MNNFYVQLAISLIVAGMPLLTLELLSRKLKLASELTRKAVHLLSSLTVAALALTVSLPVLALTGVVYFVLLCCTRGRRVWHALYGVKRTSWGEIIFPLAVSISAVVAPDKHTFIIALLILGISDTAASLLGQRYGKPIKYTSFTNKTLHGALAFLCCTFLIIAFGSAAAFTALYTAVLLTVLEFLSARGLDNLTVPVGYILLARML